MDRRRLYESPEDFFGLGGSVVMKLTPSAAIDVCLAAAARGIVVARIEGGVWCNPGFEARVDCIWDGKDPPMSEQLAHTNNLNAAQFIRDEAAVHSAFIITAPPITGWPHLKESGHVL